MCESVRNIFVYKIYSTFSYIEDVLSINNCFVNSFIDSIYPIDLQLKYTTESESPGSYVNIFF